MVSAKCDHCLTIRLLRPLRLVERSEDGFSHDLHLRVHYGCALGIMSGKAVAVYSCVRRKQFDTISDASALSLL